MALGFPVVPMKATMGSIPSGDGWAFEVKWDGYRTIAHVDAGQVRLQSTSGIDVTARWSEIAALGAAVNADRAILDGELVVLDGDGMPRFDLLQQSGPGSGHQAVFHIFDVLAIDGLDTVELPYEARRSLLDDLVEPGHHWDVPSHRIGGGADLLEAARVTGLEGVVAKRLGSRYRPGTRSRDWLKVKIRTRVELVIGGFTAGTGNRSTTFGALLVGQAPPDDHGAADADAGVASDGLRFAGGVGTGFDHATLERLSARLRELAVDTCPFDPPPPAAYRRDVTWVRPVLRAVVEIAEFTNDGLVRHASFIALQPADH